MTPAELAVNETQPRSIADQKWMLILSGVAHLNLKGNGSEWLRETVLLFPNIFTGLVNICSCSPIASNLITTTLL